MRGLLYERCPSRTCPSEARWPVRHPGVRHPKGNAAASIPAVPMAPARCRYCDRIHEKDPHYRFGRATHALNSGFPRCDFHWRFVCAVCGDAKAFRGGPVFDRLASEWAPRGLPEVVGFHRPLRDFTEALHAPGFVITRLEEPTPLPKAIQHRYRQFADQLRVPNFLIIASRKPG